jgi:hypothetical protein
MTCDIFRELKTCFSKNNETVRFVFFGDSRIRNIFEFFQGSML